MHICLITSRLSHCGVGDYTLQLAGALADENIRVTVITGIDQIAQIDQIDQKQRRYHISAILPDWQLAGMRRLIAELKLLKPDLVSLQWVPFLYHRYGVNPWLPLAALYLRRLGINLHTMVHEPWVPFNCWQFYLIGCWQRLFLSLIILASRRVSVSISAWTRMLQRYFPKRIDWTPVGSNIALVEIDKQTRRALRASIETSDERLVIGLFSPFGAGKGYDLIEALWQATATTSLPIDFLVIGATREQGLKLFPKFAADPRIKFLGYLSEIEVSKWLQCADIFLAPFTDGISTRRTSALSAMAHGLPVVTTRGHLFDREIFQSSPLIITDYDPGQFTEATLSLIQDETRRSAIGEATRKFFLEYFSWPVIVKRFLAQQNSAELKGLALPTDSLTENR